MLSRVPARNRATRDSVVAADALAYHYIILYYIILYYIILSRAIVIGFQTGSGQTGFSQKGHISWHFIILCFKCARVATFVILSRFRHMLQHFANISPWKFTRGRCGTSATTSFVPTPATLMWQHVATYCKVWQRVST